VLQNRGAKAERFITRLMSRARATCLPICWQIVVVDGLIYVGQFSRRLTSPVARP
jgi:hypothetical protein